jgi:hypothetical protein
MTAQFHGHALGNAGANHVLDGGSPEVVRDAAGTPGRLARRPPSVAEAVRGDAVAGPVPESAGPGEVAKEEDVWRGAWIETDLADPRSTCRHWSGSTSRLIRQPVTYAKVTAGRIPAGKCASNGLVLLALKDADANVVLPEHREVGLVMRLPASIARPSGRSSYRCSGGPADHAGIT